MRVQKRDGSLQAWNSTKIEHALLKAFNTTQPGNIPDLRPMIEAITRRVQNRLCIDTIPYDIHSIHLAVESTLREFEYFEVADAYNNYRTLRDARRDERLVPNPNAIKGFITTSKYAQWVETERRRETWHETIKRDQDMFIERYPQLEHRIVEAFDCVREGLVLPSMRSLQFGGKGIKQHNVRMYNCSFTLANRVRVFQEIFYALLCGCGVGASVQFQHVEQLPTIKPINKDKVRHVTIGDDVEGWADSIGELMKAYFITGEYIEFNYSKIRDRGCRLSTSGGRAPGHLGLKLLHDQLRKFLDNIAFRKLRPVEVADTICLIAEAVLSGGIRRSSIIILFSPDDSEMAVSKAPGNFEWQGKNYWRRMMNISAACIRGQTSREAIFRLVRLAKHFGEPGIYWLVDPDCGCNPCGEIGMYPRLIRPKAKEQMHIRSADESLHDLIGVNATSHRYAVSTGRPEAWSVDRSYKFDWKTYKNTNNRLKLSDTAAIDLYGHDTGFQFCNLCEINVAMCLTTVLFFRAAEAAAFIGTLQAGCTDFPYLGPVTEAITRREALLGVGLTGLCDNPDIGFDSSVLRQGVAIVRETNNEVSATISINPAARLTTVKPSGTASLALGCVGSGIHPHHARRYFRRVTEPKTNPVAMHFAKINPHMVETKPDGNLCITFCVKAPDNAITVKEMPAVKFMHDVFTVYEHWVEPGTVHSRCVVDGLTHNVSSTCVVAEDEWDDVTRTFWENQDKIGAMAFLPRMSDKGIPYMPREEVVTEADEAKWDYLIENYVDVDYTQMVEEEDGTTHTLEVACAGGSCEI